MKTQKSNDTLDTIIQTIEKKGVAYPKLVDDLKALRTVAIEEKDPLIVKVLRLTHEFITENQGFNVEGQFEEDEEGNEYPIEIDEKDNLVYLLTLLKNATHSLNREEIKDYRTALKTALY